MTENNYHYLLFPSDPVLAIADVVMVAIVTWFADSVVEARVRVTCVNLDLTPVITGAY